VRCNSLPWYDKRKTDRHDQVTCNCDAGCRALAHVSIAKGLFSSAARSTSHAHRAADSGQLHEPPCEGCMECMDRHGTGEPSIILPCNCHRRLMSTELLGSMSPRPAYHMHAQELTSFLMLAVTPYAAVKDPMQAEMWGSALHCCPNRGYTESHHHIPRRYAAGASSASKRSR